MGFYPVPVIFIFGVIYAAVDEIHQSFIPGRDCSAGDLIADITGLAIGLILYLWYRKLHICEDRDETNRSSESS